MTLTLAQLSTCRMRPYHRNDPGVPVKEARKAQSTKHKPHAPHQALNRNPKPGHLQTTKCSALSRTPRKASSGLHVGQSHVGSSSTGLEIQDSTTWLPCTVPTKQRPADAAACGQGSYAEVGWHQHPYVKLRKPQHKLLPSQEDHYSTEVEKSHLPINT